MSRTAAARAGLESKHRVRPPRPAINHVKPSATLPGALFEKDMHR
jgi:hypothetical protein